ncbi:unknown function [Streptomyces phage Dubu]|uniref:Uncharacterized protein n=1 Tax=Streptomyces phage Dubu TaxID=2591226 RepID=A0A514DET8_9CAUD|nr:unknown function [Streptomyces phage Dubu]QDH92130.1 hypothetical protein SEA_DUBU_25 [Streptomyces phage Dubu]
MRVYRVGHAEKTRVIAGTRFPVGPYNGLDEWDMTDRPSVMIWAHSGLGSDSHHPSPFADPLLGQIAAAEVCGFTSLDALLDWFDTYLGVLDENDFRVWVYDVPDAWVRTGARFGQLVFRAAEAAHVEDFEVPLDDVQLALF